MLPVALVRRFLGFWWGVKGVSGEGGRHGECRVYAARDIGKIVDAIPEYHPVVVLDAAIGLLEVPIVDAIANACTPI